MIEQADQRLKAAKIRAYMFLKSHANGKTDLSSLFHQLNLSESITADDLFQELANCPMFHISRRGFVAINKDTSSAISSLFACADNVESVQRSEAVYSLAKKYQIFVFGSAIYLLNLRGYTQGYRGNYSYYFEFGMGHIFKIHSQVENLSCLSRYNVRFLLVGTAVTAVVLGGRVGRKVYTTETGKQDKHYFKKLQATSDNKEDRLEAGECSDDEENSVPALVSLSEDPNKALNDIDEENYVDEIDTEEQSLTRIFSIQFLKNFLQNETYSETQLWEIFALSIKNLQLRPENYEFESIQGDLAFEASSASTIEHFLLLFPRINFRKASRDDCPNNEPSRDYRTCSTGEYISILNINALFHQTFQESGVYLFSLNGSEKTLGVTSGLGSEGCCDRINLSFDGLGKLLVSKGQFVDEQQAFEKSDSEDDEEEKEFDNDIDDDNEIPLLVTSFGEIVTI